MSKTNFKNSRSKKNKFNGASNCDGERERIASKFNLSIEQ